MKMFKKLLVLLLVLSMVMALVACGDSDDDDDAKEGSSRKKEKTEQVTKTPTDDPDPTDEPDPTNEPTPEPTAEPTPEPTAEPTPTEAPAPTDVPNPIGGDITADKLLGQWQGAMTASLKDFMELTGKELSEKDRQIFDLAMSFMNESGIKGDFKLELAIDFKDDKNCEVTMHFDGMEFYNGLQKFFSSEDGIYALYGAYIGVDKESAKALIAMSGLNIDDMIDELREIIDLDPDDFNITETKEAQYKIEDNKVKMTGEDALGYFVYDEAKGGLVIGTDDTSEQSKNMVKLLSGIVLKKK